MSTKNEHCVYFEAFNRQPIPVCFFIKICIYHSIFGKWKMLQEVRTISHLLINHNIFSKEAALGTPHADWRGLSFSSEKGCSNIMEIHVCIRGGSLLIKYIWWIICHNGDVAKRGTARKIPWLHCWRPLPTNDMEAAVEIDQWGLHYKLKVNKQCLLNISIITYFWYHDS